uniref:Uncharacterized protein n=1 Tax=Leersia perrieri TaxID=77586 RepID=A0A0D9Y061_9ORYZ
MGDLGRDWKEEERLVVDLSGDEEEGEDGDEGEVVGDWEERTAARGEEAARQHGKEHQSAIQMKIAATVRL